VYGVAIHSLNFSVRRPTVVARDILELSSVVPPSGRAWVVAHADSARTAERDAPVQHLEFEEVARAPYLKLQFGRTVLGEGPPTADIVLFTLSRRPEAASGAGR